MTAMWFGLAVIALVGAAALLYIDRSKRDRSGRVRQMWAKAQGYEYRPHDRELVTQFSRAALSKPEFDVALGVVTGVRRGEEFVLFDVEETGTIVAVQRSVGSDVDIDLRPRSTPPPRDEDMQLLGSIGPRVVFATDVDIARRVCDQRMAAFTESIPDNLQLLWSEQDWTLGSMPLTSSGRDWDAAIDAVARLSGMLHVLPPVRGSAVYGSRPGGGESVRDRSDPGRPLVQEPRVGPPRNQQSGNVPPRGVEPRSVEPRGVETRSPAADSRPQEVSRRPSPPRPDQSGPQATRSVNPVRPVPRPPVSRPIPFDADRRRNQP
ncbi:hypothetical protein HQO27_23560 [Rhodococcus fascians]|uniref:hypothetical protein n=1 Tax=Rhodococcoides fascians TaxID=1828 RepID=UPI0009B7F2F1|nr:hypothetical protein [Rhodococcus fascians]MBY4276212.1 hypothetical protein [Rhodococcus fascians]MBY4400257.1 hypothetical protein [Rhodococcus fascians]MBY4416291.1 hypothetical protein [Rhodococcus fascians]MBY4433755.1 hypothetical protein [Rhodococcus fascians]